MTRELHIVGVRVGAETFGLPITAVQEILRPLPLTPVPGAPAHVEGVINLRGRILPVVDLRKRCGVPAEAGRKNRIVVAVSEGRRVGLMVDAASEVLRIPESAVDSPARLFGEQSSGYVTGVAKLSGRLVILVDVGKLLAAGTAQEAL